MKYDFTKIIERHGKDAIAVEQIGSGVGTAGRTNVPWKICNQD